MIKTNISKFPPTLFAAAVLLFAALACSTLLPTPQAAPAPPAAVTQGGLPQSENSVPRVTAEEAKAAFDSGQAVIVDVRSPDAYTRTHISGAILVPLGQIEIDPTGVDLDQKQWIITYCT